ncbi:MAG: diguanylate cyclase [Erythrobacter sp.]|nr:diguanylate cyclase [Erythrobacter sp.]
MITGFEVPLEAATAASMATFALGLLAARLRDRRKPSPAANPLADLFTSGVLESAADEANRRLASRMVGHAVLRGRIDQVAMLRAGWDADARDEVLGHIASVMKAGIRRDDRFSHIEGEGFTIVMPGADEPAAKGVADRLRRALAQMTLPQSGAQMPFTASFGVAAGRNGDCGETLVARARAALDAAQKVGSDHVVAASEIEEVMYLPAPNSSAAAAA